MDWQIQREKKRDRQTYIERDNQMWRERGLFEIRNFRNIAQPNFKKEYKDFQNLKAKFVFFYKKIAAIFLGKYKPQS